MATSGAGRWTDLHELGWETATTGWQAAADFNQPRRNEAFPNTPLTVNGQGFAKGIGVYPLSEITFALSGQYSAFRAQVALDDSSLRRASARFYVFADALLLYQSSVLRVGDGPIPVELPLFGANELRLVVDDGADGSTGDYANWLLPEVFRPAVLTKAPAAPHAPGDLREEGPSAEPAWPATRRDGSITTASVPTASQPSAWFDAENCLFRMRNAHLEVLFGYGGPVHGRLAVFSADAETPALLWAASTIQLHPTGTVSLDEAQPIPAQPWETSRIVDRGLGAGDQVTLRLRAPSGDGVRVEIAIFDDTPSVTYRIRPEGSITARGYQYLAGPSQVALGTEPRLLADRTRLWRGRITDDGLTRSFPLGAGKPLLLRSNATLRGFLMSTLDESQAPMTVAVTREHGSGSLGVHLEMEYLPIEIKPGAPQASPRLLLQFVDATNLGSAFSDYRGIMEQYYPPAPMPSWVRHQWNSWWTYGPTVTEDGVRRQVDYIASNLGDLGPWTVGIDAAWHVAYGRPSADLRAIDYEKFPSGMRPVVDYAHERGVNVVLFLSAGFLHSGDQPGEWLALGAIIREHPEWLIDLASTDQLSTYMLNYADPAVRRYMETVIEDFVNKYGVDGIKLDGLADPEGQLTGIPARDAARGLDPYLPVMDIYRLLAHRLFALSPNAYFESGWINPVFAHPYAHTFWYGDDWPAFDREYPFGGLVQHIDYALFQRVALGQRPKLATVWGDPNDRRTLDWFAAGLALGAQVTAGFDLSAMGPTALGHLRSLLAHHDPFKGETVPGPGFRPNVFATLTDDMMYIGILNRTRRARSFDGEIRALGVIDPSHMAFDVDAGSWRPASELGTLTIGPRSFRLFILPRQPRIAWSNASWQYESLDSGGFVATLRGPTSLRGFAHVWAPGTWTVLLDDVPLQRASAPGPGRFALDDRTGLLRLALTFDRPHKLEVRW